MISDYNELYMTRSQQDKPAFKKITSHLKMGSTILFSLPGFLPLFDSSVEKYNTATKKGNWIDEEETGLPAPEVTSSPSRGCVARWDLPRCKRKRYIAIDMHIGEIDHRIGPLTRDEDDTTNDGETLQDNDACDCRRKDWG